ncbi:MAG: hypothetical protein R2697_09430 [Ilumatobacteraceae bacterium]
MNAATLRTATDAYTMLNGEAPADEAALVESEFLREATTDWDVVDGEVVAENPACGDVPEVTPIDDIVTSTGPFRPARRSALWTDEQIDGVGGIECATELTAILAAAPRFVEEQGVDPAGLADLVDAGYLTELPSLWIVSDNDDLVPPSTAPAPLAG